MSALADIFRIELNGGQKVKKVSGRIIGTGQGWSVAEIGPVISIRIRVGTAIADAMQALRHIPSSGELVSTDYVTDGAHEYSYTAWRRSSAEQQCRNRHPAAIE